MTTASFWTDAFSSWDSPTFGNASFPTLARALFGRWRFLLVTDGERDVDGSKRNNPVRFRSLVGGWVVAAVVLRTRMFE